MAQNFNLKNTAKATGKAMITTADKQLNTGDTASEIAQTGKNAVKGVASTGKVAAKAATGNYLGAFKEFLKNPVGVLTTALVPVIAILLIITIVMTTLVNSIWTILADKPVSNMVDEYIDDLNYAETECFSKACETVSEKALTEISEKVLEIDMGDSNLNKHKESVFKNAESIQQRLGEGYNNMRKYTRNSDSYPIYEKILTGDENIFSVLEDDSNGFSVDYNNAGLTANTTWQRVTRVIDFNSDASTHSASDYDGLQKELDDTNKIVYNFTYNNEHINANGYTFSMLEMMFNVKYDFEKEKEVNQEDGSLGLYLNEILDYLGNRLSENTLSQTEFYQYITLAQSRYNSAGSNAFYLQSETLTEINGYIDKYNDMYLKDKEDNEKVQTIGSAKDWAEDVAKQAKDDRKKEFKKFLKEKEVYENLLTYTVNVNEADYDDANLLTIPNHNTKSKNANISIKNVNKVINITIDVDICDYDTLAEIFGYKTKDENGNLVDNQELLNFIITEGGLDPDDVLSSDNTETDTDNGETEDSSQEEVSSSEETTENENTETTTTNMNNSVNANTFLFPLDLSDETIKITSEYGTRNDPLGNGMKMHKGLDIGAPMGTPIAASLPGTVVSARRSSSYGNVVEIESQVKIGEETKTVRTLYAHMSSIAVGEGATITRGENLVGYVGSTGNSTGPHLHFEVKILNEETGEFENVDPMAMLNGDGLYALNSSALTDFDGSLNSFFENCKDSGTATAAILTDAGYTKSSMFWQYKDNTYNTMFKSAVSDSSLYDFFVDKENIVRNEDGSLKIVEYTSADFEKSQNRFLSYDNAEKARASELKYNKRYYAVYCYPNTIVQLNNMSVYRCNLDFQKMSNQNWTDFWFNNAIQDTKGGINYIISDLPYDLNNAPSAEESEVTYDVAAAINNDAEWTTWNTNESKNKLNIPSYDMNKSLYDDTQEFTYLSYAFRTNSYGFDICNLQVTFPDGNGDQHLMTAEDYNNNLYGVFHQNKTQCTQTVTEKLTAEDNDSDYQLSNCILGNVLDSNFYPSSWTAYDEDDTSTYPFFVVSVTDVTFGDKSGMEDAEPIALDEIFDLDVVGDTAFVDNSSGMTWALVKSYEHTNDVYPLFNGTVISTDTDTNEITVRDTLGTTIIIRNVIPSDDAVGTFTKDTCLGKVPDGLEVQAVQVNYNLDGSIEEENVINAGYNFKVVTNISSRSEMSMVEGSEGKYNKVLSMMSGEVTSVTSSSITVRSVESELLYEYSGNGFEVDQNIIDNFNSGQKVSLASGSEVGVLYLTDSNDNPNTLSVIVYTDSLNEYENTIYYYNPANFFNFLDVESTATRKILIKNSAGKTMSGFILNRGDTMQLTAKITPDSATGAEVIWMSDNPDVVSVDATGKITASSDKYGNANISCSFADGDGIAGVCSVSVPEKRTDIQIKCANGYEQTKETKVSEDKYEDCIPTAVNSNTVIDIIWKDGKAVADFNSYTLQNAALKEVKWSIVDSNGNKNEEFATINSLGTLTAKKTMTENQTIYVKAESVDKNNPSYVLIAVRIVKPLKAINVTESTLSFTLNDEAQITKTYSYSYDPEDATYKSVDIYLSEGSEKYFTLDKKNNSITAKGVGSGYLIIKSKKYNNIVAKIELKAGYLVDEVKITTPPTELMSNAYYSLGVKGYYKGKEVSLLSDGISVECEFTKRWTDDTPIMYGDFVFTLDNSHPNGSLDVPQIVQGTAKYTFKITVVSSNTTAVSTSFDAQAYPYLAFMGQYVSSTGTQGLSDYIPNTQYYYIRSKEEARTVNNNVKYRDEFLNSSIPEGDNIKLFYHYTWARLDSVYPDDIEISFKSSDSVSVKYDKDSQSINLSLKEDYKAGKFTVEIKFKNGGTYRDIFSVEASE